MSWPNLSRDKPLNHSLLHVLIAIQSLFSLVFQIRSLLVALPWNVGWDAQACCQKDFLCVFQSQGLHLLLPQLRCSSATCLQVHWMESSSLCILSSGGSYGLSAG